jgi:DNA-binding NarL/FixJ family response regulator
MKKDIAVAIIEDDPEIRQLFTLLIDSSPGYRCKHSYEQAEDALKGINKGAVDIALMDIDLPGMSGIACTKLLRVIDPEVEVVMLTVHEDEQAIFDSLCAGACGYLLKETPPVQVLEAIQDAFAGGAPMSADIARRVVRSFRGPVDSPLSERELEVLRMLCRGDNYKMIAEAIFVSPNTVKAHIKNIYKKLQVNSRAEAVTKAYKDRLI